MIFALKGLWQFLFTFWSLAVLQCLAVPRHHPSGSAAAPNCTVTHFIINKLDCHNSEANAIIYYNSYALVSMLNKERKKDQARRHISASTD